MSSFVTPRKLSYPQSPKTNLASSTFKKKNNPISSVISQESPSKSTSLHHSNKQLHYNKSNPQLPTKLAATSRSKELRSITQQSAESSSLQHEDTKEAIVKQRLQTIEKYRDKELKKSTSQSVSRLIFNNPETQFAELCRKYQTVKAKLAHSEMLLKLKTQEVEVLQKQKEELSLQTENEIKRLTSERKKVQESLVKKTFEVQSIKGQRDKLEELLAAATESKELQNHGELMQLALLREENADLRQRILSLEKKIFANKQPQGTMKNDIGLDLSEKEQFLLQKVEGLSQNVNAYAEIVASRRISPRIQIQKLNLQEQELGIQHLRKQRQSEILRPAKKASLTMKQSASPKSSHYSQQQSTNNRAAIHGKQCNSQEYRKLLKEHGETKAQLQQAENKVQVLSFKYYKTKAQNKGLKELLKQYESIGVPEEKESQTKTSEAQLGRDYYEKAMGKIKKILEFNKLHMDKLAEELNYRKHAHSTDG